MISVVPTSFRHHPRPVYAKALTGFRSQGRRSFSEGGKRVIQHSVTSAVTYNRRGVLDARLRGHDSGW